MKYKKTCTISSISTYLLDESTLVFDSGTELRKHRLFVNNTDIGLEGVADYFYNNGTILFNKWNESDSYLYDIRTKEFYLVEKNFQVMYKNDYYIVYEGDDDTYIYKTLDLEKICSSKYFFYAIQEEYGYTYIETQIMKVNFKDETIWSFSLDSLSGSEHAPGERDSIEEIYEILGIAHGRLWFYSKHGWYGRLVAIDILTGKHEFSYECFSCFFEPKSKNIYSIASNGFIAVDTRSCSIIERYNTQEVDPSGLGTYRSVFYPFLQGDYFTFVGQKEGEYGSCGWAGIYDYKARKLVWECEIVPEAERQKTGNQLVPGNHLYISGNKLYIKDIQDNLHIFEKDE